MPACTRRDQTDCYCLYVYQDSCRVQMEQCWSRFSVTPRVTEKCTSTRKCLAPTVKIEIFWVWDSLCRSSLASGPHLNILAVSQSTPGLSTQFLLLLLLLLLLLIIIVKVIIIDEIIIFPFSALTLLDGSQEVNPVCKTLGVGLLTVMIWLELYTSYSFSLTTIQIHLENNR